jgi:hypothetical protein
MSLLQYSKINKIFHGDDDTVAEKKSIISLCDSRAIFNVLVLFSIKEKQKRSGTS